MAHTPSALARAIVAAIVAAAFGLGASAQVVPEPPQPPGVTRVCVLNLGADAFGSRSQIGQEVRAATFRDAIPLIERDGADVVILRVDSLFATTDGAEELLRVLDEEYRPRFRTVCWFIEAWDESLCATWCVRERARSSTALSDGYMCVWRIPPDPDRRRLLLAEASVRGGNEPGFLRFATGEDRSAIRDRVPIVADTEAQLVAALGIDHPEFVGLDAAEFVNRERLRSARITARRDELVRRVEADVSRSVRPAENDPSGQAARARALARLERLSRLSSEAPWLALPAGQSLGEWIDQQRRLLGDRDGAIPRTHQGACLGNGPSQADARGSRLAVVGVERLESTMASPPDHDAAGSVEQADAPRDMSPEEFRAAAADVAAFLATYHDTLAERPVWPTDLVPGEIGAMLPDHPPEDPEPWADILRDATHDDGPVLRGTTHWQHPAFLAYFPANVSAPATLADLLASGLGTQGMLWRTGPACTEVETRMLDWLVHLLDLPQTFLSTSEGAPWGARDGSSAGGGGVIHGTASEATLCSIVAARARAVRTRRAAGDSAPYAELASRCCLYASSQAHSSVVKGAMIAGLAESPDDRSRVRLIDVDPGTLAMDPDALREVVQSDLDAGLIPCWIGATLGTTSSGAFDPLERIAPIARDLARANEADPGTWLHVDAAWAGAALVCPEHRGFARGLEHADSFCFNPHKWMLTNFDCDAFFVADRRSLLDALSILPDYLRTGESDAGRVIDYRDWQIPLGRRFRALKLWFVLRHFGAEGVRAHIRRGVALAGHLEALVRADDRFRLVAPRSLGLLCVRLAPRDATDDRADDLTRRLTERVNATGRTLLTQTTLPGRGVVLRLAVGAPQTEPRHLEDTWRLIQETAAALLAE